MKDFGVKRFYDSVKREIHTIRLGLYSTSAISKKSRTEASAYAERNLSMGYDQCHGSEMRSDYT